MKKNAYNILADACREATKKLEETGAEVSCVDISADISLDGRIVAPQSEACVNIRIVAYPHREAR